MTKPLATGCIKQDNDITWRTFNLLLERDILEDSIGHLFAVDIKFDYNNASAKQRVYNEICPSIKEKQTVVDPRERSVYQLLEQYSETKKVIQEHMGRPRKRTQHDLKTAFPIVFRTFSICY